MIVDKDTAAVGALIISMLSFAVSITNYYKSLEPALNVRLSTERLDLNENTPLDEFITSITFSNPTNNAFSDLSISLITYPEGGSDELSKKAPKLNLSSMYMAPHDEKAVSISIESKLGEAIRSKSKDKIELYLLIVYSYTFFFKKRPYKILYKFNDENVSWDWNVDWDVIDSKPGIG